MSKAYQNWENSWYSYDKKHDLNPDEALKVNIWSRDDLIQIHHCPKIGWSSRVKATGYCSHVRGKMC